MNYITTKEAATGEQVQLSYEDYGSGRPVVLLHGWPLSKEMWEYQVPDLVNGGLRCILYDRRGFGASSRPWEGYDYDTLAADLHAVLEQLDLKEAVLVGFSMGGGEVVRYLSRYGAGRVGRIVLISSVLPYLSKAPDNKEGIDPMVFADMMTNMQEDRIGFLDDWGKLFFGVNLLKHPVSTPLLEYYRHLGAQAMPWAMQQCALSFAHTDFRTDVQAVTLPTLIIHGDADKTVPIDASSRRTAAMIRGADFRVYAGATHGLFYTHRAQLNRDLLEFASVPRPLAQQAGNPAGSGPKSGV
ncbi:alpha/beta hydrolase [Paraflavisolibacter sp. H34]|uniref:alpha/beta fold hydrolase n=1 Tax=Huijunlia imazamoxiresistens TaxID=3127457 RepID=UPI0030187A03